MAASTQLDGLMRWLNRPEWSGEFNDLLWAHLGPACEGAGIAIADLGGILGDHMAATLWGCAFEDFLTRVVGHDGTGQGGAGAGGRNIVDDYLRRRGRNETAATRAYMQALRHSAMSLYEVSGIVPGASFLARDLVRGGEPVLVSERSATLTLAPWARIGARLVPEGGGTVMAGGMLVFPFDRAEALAKEVKAAMRPLRRHLGKIGQELDLPEAAAVVEGVTDDMLLGISAPAFSNAWLEDALARAMGPGPSLVNTDGDDILFHTVRWPLLPGAKPGAVRGKLRTIPGFREEGRDFWNWTGEAAPVVPPPSKASRGDTPGRWERITYGVTLDDGSTVLGTVGLEGRAVVLRANSPARAERGQALVAPVLEGLAGAPSIEVQTVEEAAEAGRDTPAPALDVPAEVQEGMVHEALETHYRAQLDQPVPMLGGKAPRALARSRAGRQKVAGWLKGMENVSRARAGDPMASYDFGWIWRELGVEDLRR